MDRNDEQLVQRFFAEASEQTIPDAGFSERVMQRLPSRSRWFSRWWTAGCIAVAAALFVALDGWTLLVTQLEVFVRTTMVEPPQFNLPVMAVTVFGLFFTALYELLMAEHVIR